MRVTILRTLVLLLALLATSPAAGAGTLRLEFGDGYVTISAVSVPLRQVLTEWARLGQTRVVNAEKLGGAPLTIELLRVPEKQALEILLRSVPGYMAARRATFVPGGSQFDRIVVMPGTVAPPSQAATPPPAAPPPPAPPPTPMPAAAVDDQDEPVPQENPEQAGAAEQDQDQDQDQPQPQPEPGQQPQTLPSPGVQPLPPAPPGQQNDGDGVPPQQPAGPTAVPGGGAVVSPNPGQLPLPPAKPPNQQDQ